MKCAVERKHEKRKRDQRGETWKRKKQKEGVLEGGVLENDEDYKKCKKK